MLRKLTYVCGVVMLAAACSSPPEAPKQTPAPPPPAADTKSAALTAPKTDADKIANAMAAAPQAIAKDAAVVEPDAQMKIRTIRAGTNGWTCIPDSPQSPGIDPMCVDKNGLDWLNAYLTKKAPPKDKIGFAYMLAGGSDASNEDPYATGPAAGHQWIDTGPHVMLFNVEGKLEGYPASHDNPKAPYWMWSKTPYAHLMIPVK
jgi:hypothetical protein